MQYDIEGASGGDIRKELESIRKDNSSKGARLLKTVESGSWTVHAPCLMRRAPNSGRANTTTEITIFKL